MLDCLKWPLDYLIKCHVSPDELYVQVGDGAIDHEYWGRPEDMNMPRPAFVVNKTKPGEGKKDRQRDRLTDRETGQTD